MKKRDHVRLLPLLLSAVLLSGCAAASSSPKTEDSSAQKTESNSPQTAQPAAAPKAKELSSLLIFEAQDLNGNTVSSAVFSESKLTMVNVWATYCSPCLSEMPDLGQLAAEYDPEEFQLIGIISDVQENGDSDAAALAADLVERTGADYPHLLLNQSLYDALLTDVTAVPTTFFINESGKIIDTVVGSMEKSAWEERINELLEER
ncbi:MAG: TlpA disulfide reductase family protein [Lachnospiraceae bacterium]|nr:TlpA disulfide reductase family protein [Lachnospiraceae bacterium]